MYFSSGGGGGVEVLTVGETVIVYKEWWVGISHPHKKVIFNELIN